MAMTEQLMADLVKSVKGSYKFQYHANGHDQPPVEIDFTPPFRRVSMVSGLEQALGVTLPGDMEGEQARLALVQLVRAGGSCWRSRQSSK